MEKAGDFLSAALRRLKDPEAARTWLEAAWPSLVGDAMAVHIRPAAFANGILCVEADSREWHKQAESMSQDIRERVNSSWGRKLVSEMRVEAAKRGNRLAYEVDNDHIPFIRKPASAGKS